MSEGPMTNSISEALKPCPFCGGEAAVGTIHYKSSPYCDDEHKTQLDYFSVNCVSCIVTMRGVAGYPTEEQAVAKWNERITPPLDSEAVEAILGDLQATRTNIIAAKGLSALTYLDEAIAALTAMKEDDRGEGMVDE